MRHQHHQLFSLFIGLCLIFSLSACTGQSAEPTTDPVVTEDPADSTQPPETESPADTTQEPAADSDSHYPVEITTYNFAGEEVVTVYEKAPERVLAVYQGCIETMIALGLEDRVVASYGLDNEVKDEWKSAFEKMNYDDSVFAPDKETVVMLEPDMIFSWGSYFADERLGDVNYWIESGTNPYINTNTRRGGFPRTLDNEYTDLLNIGKIFNVEEKAQAIVDEMKLEVENALAFAQGRDPQTVAVIEFLSGSISNYTSTQLGGDMVTQLGGTLAIEDTSSIGSEDLLEYDPDVIFIVYMAYAGEDGEDVKATSLSALVDEPSYASLSAVQNGRVYTIMLGDMYASAVRTIDGIRTFASGLYPDTLPAT